MDFLDDSKDFKLIISNNKKYVIDYISSKKKLIKYKVMSLTEFRKRYYFDYDNKAVFFLMKKYNMKFANARMFIDNMIYLEDGRIYKHKKLMLLKNFKDELVSGGLLIYDKYFKDYLKDKKIYILENNVSKFDKNMFEEVNKYTPVEYINLLNPIYEHTTLHFNTINDEVDFVCYKISELIHNGISIDKIKLTNVSSEYVNPLKRMGLLYNLKFDFDNKTPLYSTEVCKKFLAGLSDTRKKSLESISEYKDTVPYNLIVNLLNEYSYIDNVIGIKELILEEVKSIYLPKEKLTNVIECVDYRNYQFTDEYVFMVNFNNGSIPIIKKDESYITDNIKDEVCMDLVVEENVREKENVINIIKSIKNLTITYKDRSYFDSFYPSNLIDIFPVIEESKDILKSYSSDYDKITLCSKMDNLIKYGTKDKELDILRSNYHIPYKGYNHKFSGISKSDLKEYLDGKLKLSYSAMDNYNKCAFRYYVSNILRLDIYEETFQAFVGLIFHDVLQKGLLEEINVSKTIREFIKNSGRELTKKENFFVEKLTGDLERVLAVIKDTLKYTDLDKFMFEHRIEVLKERDLSVTFSGIVDKIMYKEYSDKVLMVVIDYKTYKTEIDLKYLKHGLNMQLPIYLYLAKNMNIENVVFGGFYLQQVLSSSLDKNEATLKLEGYSNSDQSILELVDNTYMSSKYIKGLRVKSDGDFYSNSRVLSNEQIDELVTATDEIINNVIDNISSAKFDINPKYTTKNVACEFCKFKDICYMDESDVKYIHPIEFLGGDENA